MRICLFLHSCVAINHRVMVLEVADQQRLAKPTDAKMLDFKRSRIKIATPRFERRLSQARCFTHRALCSAGAYSSLTRSLRDDDGEPLRIRNRHIPANSLSTANTCHKRAPSHGMRGAAVRAFHAIDANQLIRRRQPSGLESRARLLRVRGFRVCATAAPGQSQAAACTSAGAIGSSRRTSAIRPSKCFA
jgi:acetolactate synthase regulatory subunit